MVTEEAASGTGEGLGRVDDVVLEVFGKGDDGAVRTMKSHRLSMSGCSALRAHGSLPVLAKVSYPGVFAMIVYRSSRKVWAVGMRNDPLFAWPAMKCYEVGEIDAIKFIDERGGLIVEGFDVEKVLESTRGVLVGEVVFQRYYRYGSGAGFSLSDWGKESYRLYERDGGLRVWAARSRMSNCGLCNCGLWRSSSCGDFAREFVAASRLGLSSKKEITESMVDAFPTAGEVRVIVSSSVPERVVERLHTMALLESA